MCVCVCVFTLLDFIILIIHILICTIISGQFGNYDYQN